MRCDAIGGYEASLAKVATCGARAGNAVRDVAARIDAAEGVGGQGEASCAGEALGGIAAVAASTVSAGAGDARGVGGIGAIGSVVAACGGDVVITGAVHTALRLAKD